MYCRREAYVLGNQAVESFRLSDNVSILAAELEAIHAAVKIISESSTAEIKRYIIHTDSLGALQSLQSENSTSRPIQIANIKASISAAIERGVEIELCWIPGHVGIKGNETADVFAKSATTKKEVDIHIKLEMKELKNLAEEYIRAKWQKRWNENTTGREYYTMEPTVSKASKFRYNDREMEKTITRLRLRKCYLNSYMHKIRRHRDGLCDTCGVPETVDHYLMHCRANRVMINNLETRCKEKNVNFSTNQILKHYDLLNILADFIKELKRKL